jgi:hypothetical protein
LIDDEADLGLHRLRCEWLDDVVHGAVRIALEDVLLLAPYRRDEDDGRVSGALPLSNERRGLETVELGHLQDEGAILVEQEAQRLSSGAGLGYPVAERLQNGLESEQVRLAIIDDKLGVTASERTLRGTWIGHAGRIPRRSVNFRG